jgi:RIO-like serine/threonine protein kinase
MVKLDVTCMRHMAKNDFRVLTAVEVRGALALNMMLHTSAANPHLQQMPPDSSLIPSWSLLMAARWQPQMGMKNHDVVPVDLIASIAKLRTGGVHRIITTLHAFKLIAHDRSTYDGYRCAAARAPPH